MKLKYIFKKKRYEREFTCFNHGKYAQVPINELETLYIAHALENFLLEEGMRYVLTKELIKRCKIKEYI